MNNARFGFILFILLTALGIRFFLFYGQQSEYKDGQKIRFETTLLSEPGGIGNYQKLSANLASGDKIFITIPRYPQYYYGDKLIISGIIKIKSASNFSNQKNRLITNEKTIMTMYFPKVEAVNKEQNLSFFSENYILSVASFVRQKVVILFEKTLDQTSSGLLLGIVFGIKKEMPLEFTDSIRKVGVMHVIAASGMNVTMIAGFLSSLFGFFLNRKSALLLTIVAVLFYALMSGLQPSIIRASIMGVLVFSSQVLGRQRLSYYILFLTAFLMLFVSPGLIEDVGFQLSFLATFGLLYLKPLFDQLYPLKFNKRFLVGEDVSTTIAAQAATLPIILANFGTYSLWSVIVNGILLWTIPVIMVLGGFGAITGIVFEPLGQLFIYLSLPFLLLFEKIVSIFAGLGGAIVIINFPWQFISGYYLILLGLAIYIKGKKDYAPQN